MPWAPSVISNGIPKSSPAPAPRRRSLYHPLSSNSLRPAVKKPLSCCTAGILTPNPAKPRMRSHIPAMDTVDFDNLPPAVRRKYFSSLERLRYAQQHQSVTSPLPPMSHGRTMSSASGKFSRLRSKNRPSYDSFRSTNSIPRAPKFNKPDSGADAFLLSQADAEWYLELPETIRRKHFSRDERILLATKCESIIVDAADEAIYRKGRQANRSLDTLDSGRSSIADLTESPCDAEALNCIEEIRKSFRWLDEDGALDLRLDEYYCPASNKHETDPAQSRSPIRGTPSIASKTHRTHSSFSSTPARPSLGIRRQTSHSTNFARHQPSFSQCSNSTDTDAAYYQDPEARLKLRVYLASPQKFDEAVEFGFPSTTDSKGFINCRPRTATARELESETGDLTPKEGNPSLNDFGGVSMGVGNVMDYQKLRELQDRAPSAVASSKTSNPVLFDPYPHTSAGNREMTLRMTLTRKDLRADENELYGWKKDPLALEELPPASDSDACHFDWGNTGKNPDSGLKKLWRRVRGFR